MDFVLNNLITVGIGMAAGVILSVIVHLGNTANLRRRIKTLKRQNNLLLAEVKEVTKENGWLREANEQLVPHPEVFKRKHVDEEDYERMKKAQCPELAVAS